MNYNYYVYFLEFHNYMQVLLTTADLALCSRLIKEPNLQFLAGMLDISDGELSSICSRHKNTQAQAYQILNLWYKRSTSHQKRQDLLDALENASFFDAARRLVERCIEHVCSLPLVAACPCVHPD